MKRSQLFVAAVARVSLVAMTVFTLAVAVRVLGGDLPPGHPPVEACPTLPPGHPSVDLDRLPPGHPPVGADPLPEGHPPVDGLRMPLPVFTQEGTSSI
jgi:hypothetical protein